MSTPKKMAGTNQTSMHTPGSYTDNCLICGGNRIHYEFINNGCPVCQCADCGFMFLNPKPYGTLAAAASTGHFDRVRELVYARHLLNYGGFTHGRILDVSAGPSCLDFSDLPGVELIRVELKHLNHEGAGQNQNGLQFGEGYVDAFSCIDGLQKVNNPQEILSTAWSSLKDGGILLLVIPSLNSRGAVRAGKKWEGFAKGNNYFFDNNTIQNLMVKCGFGDIRILQDYEYFQLELLRQHYHQGNSFENKILSVCVGLVPESIKSKIMKISHSGVVVLARKQRKRVRPLLSIIMPIYNEVGTFAEMYSTLKNKELPGVDKEIVIVESNSTDGTRDLIKAVSSDPGIKIIYEEKPCGKGHAVRNGFQHASGDFVIIQDGDLEYDVNDYDQLLEPLLNYQQAFVLGSRHAKGWKMRHFEDQPFVSFVMNLGQTVFVFLLNAFCGSELKDPFTMYKVFRRDCLSGLSFKANRFDFDWEIVIKFLRKGYVPLEIPVNYNSRSFGEGKKVSFLKDPPLWMIALVRFRFSKLYDWES